VRITSFELYSFCAVLLDGLRDRQVRGDGMACIVEGMDSNEPAGSLPGMTPASHRRRRARCRHGLERTVLVAANPACEQAQEREEVGLLILTFAQSPEPGTSPAPKTPPPGLDSGQVVEHPPPVHAPAGRLGHWQG